MTVRGGVAVLWVFAAGSAAYAASEAPVWVKLETAPDTVAAESLLRPSTEVWRASRRSGLKGSGSGVIVYRSGDETTVALQGPGGWRSSVLKGPRARELWMDLRKRTERMGFIPKDAQAYRTPDAALGWCLRWYTTPPSPLSPVDYSKFLQAAPKAGGCVNEKGERELAAVFEALQKELRVQVPARD